MRRVRKACANIQLKGLHQETFLSNEGNKAQFNSLLSLYLESDGQTGDADTMIVDCALPMAMEGKEVTVVADDIMHHWTESMADVYFLSEPNKSQKKGLQVWRMSDLITKAGTLTSHLLFMHFCHFRAGKNKYHEEDQGL